MLAALNAPDGMAHGVLVGEQADAISKQFQSNSPIHIDISTLQRLPQPDCRRLNVRFWQDGVLLPRQESANKPIAERKSVDFAINFCSDGQPPRPAR